MAYLRLSELNKALADGYHAAAGLPRSTLVAAFDSFAQAVQGQWIASATQLARTLE